MEPTTRISLELELGEPISGSARGDGDERQFRGWLELYAAIDRLRRLAIDEPGRATQERARE